jgi:hypothetical protein
VDEWVTAVGLRREDYGTHSLRRTKPSGLLVELRGAQPGPAELRPFQKFRVGSLALQSGHRSRASVPPRSGAATGCW